MAQDRYRLPDAASSLRHAHDDAKACYTMSVNCRSAAADPAEARSSPDALRTDVVGGALGD